MKKKPNFNGTAEKFARCIYDSAKGKVRLAVLKRDLDALRNAPPMRVLDVGAGMGQMAIWFAQAGHEITLCDISEEMLETARSSAQAQGLDNQMSFYHAGLQQLPEALTSFDLVICHAVLEWIEDQQAFIQLLSQRVKPKGHLSLMAFNRKALLFNHFIAGNFEYAQSGMKRRSRQRLTPNWPVEPSSLNGWLAESQLKPEVVSGVRLFSDYVRDKTQVKLEEEAVVALELEHSRDPDWLPVSRYLHYLCQRDSG